MEPAAIEALKAKAKRIRDRKHWLILVFVLIAMVPAVAAVVFDTFPSVSPKYIFLGAVLAAVTLAQVVHNWQVRTLHPRCPKCGAEWQIMEGGPFDNRQHFEDGGKCPKCGA